MAIDKQKLTPESKRTLLEQSLQWIGSLKLHEESDKNVPAFFSFIKLILINQSFLNTSRYASFDIYEFYLDFQCRSPELYCLSFNSKYAGFFQGIKLSFERDHKLVKLLQPPKIGLDFRNKIEKKSLNELIEILKATTGEISMEVTSKIDPSLDVMNAFSSRIRRFSCIGRFFTNCVIPSSFDSLNELKVRSIKSADQFLKILKCNVNSFDLSFYGYLLDAPNSFELPMPANNEHFLNKTVKQLGLNISGFDYACLKRIIEQVLKFFPSLVELKIDAISRYNEHPENQISNVASDSCQYIRALKDRLFANGLKKIAFKFKHCFNCDEKHNSEWINKTSNKPEFKNWKFKLEHRNVFVSRFVILKLSTEEGNSCKFGIELEGEYEANASNGRT